MILVRAIGEASLGLEMTEEIRVRRESGMQQVAHSWEEAKAVATENVVRGDGVR